MSDADPIPYLPNQFRERLLMIGDAAQLLFDQYGKTVFGEGGVPIQHVGWEDAELKTVYELVRIQPGSPESSLHEGEFEFAVTQKIGDEELVKVFNFNPQARQYGASVYDMPAEMEEEFKRREEQGRDIGHGYKVLPPEKYELEPEQELELHQYILGKAFQILETTREAG